MILIRKFLKSISFFLTGLILFVSCEQYDNNASNFAKYSGEELFKSIVFADGKLANELPALSGISQLDRMSKDEINELRTYENDIIAYLKSTNKNYFVDFKNSMYSQNPEVISNAISKTAKDIVPWVNKKLAIHGLTVEKIAERVNFDGNGNLQALPDVSTQQKCGVLVYVAAVVVVAVAAVWVVAISAVAIVGGGDETGGPLPSGTTITQESISIQIAEALSL